MARTKSIDDLKTAHLHFCQAVETRFPDPPQFIADQKSSLCATYAELVNALKSRTVVGVQKTDDLALRNAWTKRADKALSRARLRLRADAPENFREYFPETNGIASRKIDRLHAIDRVLTVSEHFEHAHLGDLKDDFEALKDEGASVFEAASASVTEQKSEVKKLKDLKSNWETQYQKLKMLFRSYFYGTSTDWAMFFYEKREAKNGSAKESAPEAADSTEYESNSIALAS